MGCKLLGTHAQKIFSCQAPVVLFFRFNLLFRLRRISLTDLFFFYFFRLQHHRMCPEGARSLSGGECSPDEGGERADGETLLSVTDSDSDLDV